MNLLARYRGLLIGAALLVAVAALAAWRLGLPPFAPRPEHPEWGASGERGDGRHHQGEGDEPAPVTVARAKLQDVPLTVDWYTGTVLALNTTTIRTQVDGRLIKLPFNEGEDVKKGDVVALIEPNLYQAAYDQAVAKKAQDEANLANARIDVVRYEKLAKSNYGSQQQWVTQKYLVAQLEAQVRADQGAIDSAKTTLDYCTIRSPIDGRTGIRLVDVGNILHAVDQTGILVITQLKPIYVTFNITDKFLPTLQRAMAKGPAKVTVIKEIQDGRGGVKELAISNGQVSVVDNQIDPATRTVKIKATFPNDDLALWPGDFVKPAVEFDTLKNALTVPKVAIQSGPTGGSFVYLLGEDGAVTQTPVTTAFQDENIAVVSQGLDVGAQVVTHGVQRLSNGVKVTVVQSGDDGAAAPKDKAAAEGVKSSGGGERRHRRDHDGAPPPTEVEKPQQPEAAKKSD
ncbi:MAG TPA: efflux RND transporter periplasmic adaptor subunit [Methylocystis sp.]|nr:efflux RND transporter periplasmic adaptor subunit [Methylocystis sp.]